METEISIYEKEQLNEYEKIIEHGLTTFVDVGLALLSIRDKKLYRETYNTFEEYCRERWGLARRQAYLLIDAASAIENVIHGSQILPTNERQVRPLTSLSPDLQALAWQKAVETAPDGKITSAHVQQVVDEIKGKPHVTFNSGNNEWYTPPEYIDAARSVMGKIDLDPASSDKANEIVGATIYFTEEDNGLNYSWDGKVWMNPPYASDLIGKFTKKLIYHYSNRDITEAVILVNNATDTAWFQEMLGFATAVCFIRGRVRFIDMDGNPSGAPLQGQAVLYLGGNISGFSTSFSKFGVILYGD